MSGQRQLAHLAARQHGLFTRQQALMLGFSRGTIQQRVGHGAWEVVARGVYAVPGCPWTWRRKLMLALLDAGCGAVVSHEAAAALLGLPGFRPSLVGYHTMRFMWGDLVMRPDWVNDVVRRFLQQAGCGF